MPARTNFVKTMLQLGRTADNALSTIRLDARPALTTSRSLLQLVDNDLTGFHLAGSEDAIGASSPLQSSIRPNSTL